MNLLRLLLVLACLPFSSLPAADPVNRSTSFDAEGRFTVTVEVPAGSHHAVLEMTSDPASSAAWRKMIAGVIDGRAARVTFRLPSQGGARAFVRVRTGVETTPPAVELSDPALVSVSYESGISEAVKVTFLNAAGAKMREWKSLPRTQSQAKLIAWALTDPNVVQAVVSPVADNVSIRFADGDICVLLNKPRTAADASGPPPSAAGVAPQRSVGPRTVAIGSLPGSNKAVTAFSLESTFPNSAPTIAGWLASKGYAATTYPSTTVNQVMNWATAGDPLGVLFWHAHGCSYTKADNTEGIGIITREYCDPDASHPVYSAMRKNGELMLAKDDSEALPYYGITSKFIRSHMHFAPHSVVVLDACFGAHADLGDAFLAAGAGSFASWDWLSGPDSGTPCLKIFDRLLGANQEPPISTPKERSFALDRIIWWMNQNGYQFDPSPKFQGQTRNNAKLVWYHHPQKPAHILLPSLMRVLAEASSPGEEYSKYLLEGDFGPDPGAANRSVLWGNQPMQVVKWDALDGIVIRMPDSPPKGEIQVVMNKDYYAYSNKVPITEWTVPFTYELKAEGSLTAVMELNVKFRGDIHGSRGAPEMEPQYLGVVFSNMKDCTGTISASGSHHPDSSTTDTWSGGSSLTSVDPNASGNPPLANLIYSNGVLQIPTGSSFPFSLTANGSFTSTHRVVDSEGRVYTTVSEESMGLDGMMFFFAQPISFNPGSSALNGGTRSLSLDPGSAKLTWPTVTPVFRPDQNTPR